MFLSISKGDKLRFLGHLDLLRAMERAIVRADIPIAFSEGFNPHMKIAFDAALGVGVSASPLYMEIRLEKEIS
ncbi:MAG: TIGR03936 family radical SAM-associated protein, partial [Dialister sp.]|nr:TIGR03936 family radical SAM-associated protein [Dialister sp.]